MVFYEAPHKLVNTLKDMYSYFGDREIALVREITKIHEEVIRTTLSQAESLYSEQKPKGEFVLILAGKNEKEQENITLEQAVKMAEKLVDGGMSVNSAAKEIASQTPFKKSDIYKQLL